MSASDQLEFPTKESKLNLKKLISSLDIITIPETATQDYQVYQCPAGQNKHGTLGKRTDLVTNYANLEIKTASKKLVIFEYKVDFQPELEELQTQKLFLLNGQFNKIIGHFWIFRAGMHRKTLYLNFKLDECDLILFGKHPRDDKAEHMLILELIENVTSENQQLTRFCDALFIRVNEILGMLELGVKVYQMTSFFHDPKKRLEIWPGLLTYARYYDSGLMIGFDPTIRVVRTTNAYDTLQILRRSLTDIEVKHEFMAYAVGKRFMTKFGTKIYEIVDIDWTQTPLSEIEFQGQVTTYAEYYSREFGLTIKNMNQPLFVYCAKSTNDNPKQSTIIFKRVIPELCYPMRLCETWEEKLSIPLYLKTLIKLSPCKKFEQIQNYAIKIKENADCVNLLKNWNLEMGDFLKAEGRTIDQAILNYGDGLRKVQLNGGRIKNYPFIKPIALKRWLVFCSKRDFENVQELLYTYLEVSKTFRVEVYSPKEIITVEPPLTISNFINAVKNSMQSYKDIQFVLVVIPRIPHRDIFYNELKKVFFFEFDGLPSQFIKPSTLTGKSSLNSIVGRMNIQINCKLGGAPWGLHLPSDEAIMFVGIDAYHDPRKRNPSAFAIIFSLNTACTKYYSRVLLQTPHQETGNSIFPIFSQALSAYYEENQRWPDRIVVFRDGVNNRHMELIKELELGQMRFATSFLPTKPKFIFIIVQKRIIERLFQPQDQGTLPMLACQSGTLVDKVLTRVNYVDFFLFSQLRQQNCVIPIHYVVIANDDDSSPDYIQKLTHLSCFMYFNAREPIKMPGICQYAHRLASFIGSRLMKEPVGDKIHKTLYYL